MFVVFSLILVLLPDGINTYRGINSNHRGNDMSLISIIIPVFNNRAEDITKCIESLYDDKYTDKVESIVIDDGSCSECSKVLDELPLRFSKVKVFHQTNKGVSNARNTGVTFASGKYVAFVDADDVVTKNFIPDAISAIEKSEGKLDIIYGFVKFVETDDKIHITDKAFEQDYDAEYVIISDKEKDVLKRHFFDLSGAEFRLGDCYLSRGPVARLVKKELVEQHKFEEKLSQGEDMIWNLDLLKVAKCMGIVRKLWYYYISNPESASHTFGERSIEEFGNTICKLSDYANDNATKSCLLNYTIWAASAIAKGYFLSNKFNSGFFQAIQDFNRLFSIPPWNVVLKIEYAYKVGWKCLIKYGLIKTGTFLIAIKLKKILTEK